MDALLSPAPRNAKTAKSICATDTDAYAKKSLSESPSDATGAAARVGRSCGSAGAGGRPAPPYGPLQWLGSRFRSPSLCIYMYLSTAQVAAHSGIFGRRSKRWRRGSLLCVMGALYLSVQRFFFEEVRFQEEGTARRPPSRGGPSRPATNCKTESRRTCMMKWKHRLHAQYGHSR